MQTIQTKDLTMVDGKMFTMVAVADLERLLNGSNGSSAPKPMGRPRKAAKERNGVKRPRDPQASKKAIETRRRNQEIAARAQEAPEVPQEAPESLDEAGVPTL